VNKIALAVSFRLIILVLIKFILLIIS